MTAATVWIAIARFACWETALFTVAIVLTGALGWRGARRTEEKLLAVLGVEIVLESTFAAIFSFARINGPAAYWISAGLALLAVLATRGGRDAVSRAISDLRRAEVFRYPRTAALFAGLLTPLIFISFRPVEEPDSINYLHYLIDWMANRATPYTFATNYVAFWELSFLPAWTVTRVDLFFPLLALKAVALLALAAWLLGRELGLRRRLLLWTVFGVVVLRHLWFESSGVPTLKNDVLHGAGFILVTLAVLRASRRRLTGIDAFLFALGAAFVSVKYTGIFVVVFAAAVLLYLERRHLRPAPILLAGLGLLFTSGHYYLHNLLLYGNPFYPFQINLAFIHLPGTADLSGTSILYNLRNPGLWRAFFLPAGGVSMAGLLFPVILVAALVLAPVCLWLRRGGRTRSLTVAARIRAARVSKRFPKSVREPHVWAAVLVLLGWFLYFRSVYSAGTAPGNIGFLLNLNTVRYVIGVLAASELLLVALLARFPRLAFSLVILNAASRLGLLYVKLPSAEFPISTVLVISVAAALVWLTNRRALVAVGVAFLVGGPWIVERNHAHWLDWWADLKPAISAVRGNSLAILAYDDLGYFAGHIFAAGNPVHPEVRALEREDLDAGARPRYLAVLPTPGSSEAATWRSLQAAEFARWGYTIAADSKLGAILERTLTPVPAPSGGVLDALYAGEAIRGMPAPGGHVFQNGDVVADAAGNLFRLDPRGRQPLDRVPGMTIRLLNCGDSSAGAVYRWEGGTWHLLDRRSAIQLPSPTWITSISDGRYRQEVLSEDGKPFIRMRAENDARWLIFSAPYPDGLHDDIPITVLAEVRCPNGCSVSTAGHTPDLNQPVRSSDWTAVNLSFAYQKSGRPQHYAVGLAACHRGDWFDLRSFELRIGRFPYN